MVEFATPLELDFGGARFADGPLAWAARDPERPGRPSASNAGERWVLHARGEWTRAHLEEESEAVGEALLHAFATALELWGVEPSQVTHRAAHRWRHARPLDGPGDVEREERVLADDATGLVLAGDWVAGRRGARVEAAWLSGVAAAARILARGPGGPVPRGGAPNEPVPASVAQEELFA
jgi:hypothetical protein